MKRVAFVSKRDILHHGGGGDVYAHQIAKRLTSKYSVSMVTTRIAGGSSTELIDNVEVIRIGSREMSSRVQIPRYLMQHCKEIDVIVENVTVVPWMMPLLTTKPKIAIVHQLLREIFFHELPKTTAWPAYVFEPFAFMPYRHLPIVCPAGETTIRSLVDIGFHPEHINRIEPGLPEEYLRRGRDALSRKATVPTILVATRLEAYKRVDYALYAMREVLRVCPEAKMIVMGAGKQLTNLKCLSERLGLSNNVEFCGFVSEEDKMRLLAEAHVHIWSLGYRDGAGLSILEANAFHTPSVAWQAIGPCDTIAQDKTGKIIPYGDISLLARAILSLLKDHELRSRLATNAYRYACAHTWEKAASQFSNLIETVTEQG